MSPSGANARRQSTQRRTVLKKSSNDSCVGSSSPSAAWSTCEARFSASASSTIGPLISDIKPERSSFEPSSSQRSAQPVTPNMLGPSLNSEKARGKVRRLESWLKEQQGLKISLDDAAQERIAKAAGTPCHPYLAYPALSRYTSRQDGDDDDEILGSFVIVEEEESEDDCLGGPPTSDNGNNFETSAKEPLSTSSTSYTSWLQPSSLRAPRPASILSVSSWRNLPFTKTLPTHRHPSAPTEPIDLSTPPTTLRFGPARRRSPIPEDLLKTDTSSVIKGGKTAQNKASSATLRAPDTPRSSVRKRLGNFMRPNGNHNTNSESPASAKTSRSSRPSTSTSVTTATTSTAVENELRSVGHGSPKRFLPKFNLNLSKAARQPPEDIRLDSPTHSAFSVSLQHDEPESPSPLPEPTFSHPELLITPTLTKRRSQPSIFRDKRHNASSSALSTLSIGSIGTMASNINGRAGSVFSGSSTARRKRLVVSGIEPDDSAAVQGLRRWCERFGELRSITRMPNGDLHIDFKRADVADTVCRISARVHIEEVGSVNMSWISGKRH